jgi:calcineurin-like phosphoesterase family protein
METYMKPMKIVSCSDIHYFADALHDNGSLFKKTMNTADGKHTAYVSSILSAFIEEMLEEKPDYVFISGDLTFNGEKLSHYELKQHLNRLLNAGIQVLVIPGNHDVNFPFSYHYIEDEFFPTENISADEFKEIYSNCGYGQDVLSMDESSLSYIYPLSKNVWLFALDANANGHKGMITDATIAWMEPWLKKARKAGKVIFTMTHQNVSSHNLLTSPGYELFNAKELRILFEKYGIAINFSGHMHVQHIKTINRLSTIASGSLSVVPNLYGKMEIDETGKISYRAKSVDVEKWAHLHEIKDYRLRHFSRESRTYFNQVWGWQINQELDEYHISPLERVGLVDFCTRVINAYLAGQTFVYRRSFLADPLYKKWQTMAPGSFFQSYLESILDDPANSVSDIALDIQLNKEGCCKDVFCLSEAEIASEAF